MDDGDTQYWPMNSAAEARALARQGKIRYSTCARVAAIPISYLLSLLEADYNEGEEPGNWKNAVHHWILSEICTAVGGHSIL